MKLISFERDGRPGFGAGVDGGVVDLGAALGRRHADSIDGTDGLALSRCWCGRCS